jgi:hypothetical protein
LGAAVPLSFLLQFVKFVPFSEFLVGLARPSRLRFPALSRTGRKLFPLLGETVRVRANFTYTPLLIGPPLSTHYRQVAVSLRRT